MQNLKFLTMFDLNQLIIFHVHKHLTDKIDIKVIANEFISVDSARKAYFDLKN